MQASSKHPVMKLRSSLPENSLGKPSKAHPRATRARVRPGPEGKGMLRDPQGLALIPMRVLCQEPPDTAPSDFCLHQSSHLLSGGMEPLSTAARSGSLRGFLGSEARAPESSQASPDQKQWDLSRSLSSHSKNCSLLLAGGPTVSSLLGGVTRAFAGSLCLHFFQIPALVY